jgi:hypothetical protein
VFIFIDKMQISDQRVKQYQELYREKYGKDIDIAKARDELTALACYLDAIYKFQNINNQEK